MHTVQSRTGRRPTTGKFETREELESKVINLHQVRKMSSASIARICNVSRITVNTILSAWEITRQDDLAIETSSCRQH
jgi:transposase